MVSGANALYLEGLYAQWKANPSQLDAQWDDYFRSMEAGKTLPALPSGTAMRAAASDAKLAVAIPDQPMRGKVPEVGDSRRVSAMDGTPAKSNSFGVNHLIRSYQVRGHEMANLDPLGLHQWRKDPPMKELTPEYHGFSEADLDVKFAPSWLTRSSMGAVAGFLSSLGAIRGNDTTIRDLVETLHSTYCNTMGIEYMHIANRKYCNWVRSRVETPLFHMYDQAKALKTYTRLCYADTFERFLQEKFKNTKRFGIDGGEAVIPGIKACMDRMVEFGAEEFVIGMPHRGRLNVLAGVLKKPMPVILREFMGTAYDVESKIQELEREDWSSAGDVKYHLGTSHVRTYPSGQKVRVTLEANPSHLETVNPVAIGRARAKQYYLDDPEDAPLKVVPILFHGDASFAGQGVVYETMQLAHVEDFHVGGTIHVIVNNQVGFTTDPKNSRSTGYASDLGKAFNIPILHVNADDPLAVVRAFELAGEWRQAWRSDIIIDVICYRRLGHNEADNPEFTQPLLYQAIQKHSRSEQLMAERLIHEGHATPTDIETIRGKVRAEYERAWEQSQVTQEQPKAEWLATKWEGFHSPNQLARHHKPTGVELETLRAIGKKLVEVPPDFKVHSGVKRVLKAKQEKLESGTGLDWGTAEALAFGSLMLEGNHVRITGQDVQRGTFSHRHCVIIDQNTGEEYNFLNSLDTEETFVARNSILSEYAVMGFELGYSYENPDALVIWEAQFGDFANTAQVITDQFLSAGEHKWMQQSALTLLLPHGYDGQGAEHSSCRLERFLQLCDDDEDDIPDFQEGMNLQVQKANWQVMNLSTPANYFHALRQQLHRDFRKPLIVAAPKFLLRHKACISSLDDMGPDSSFQRLISERDQEIASNPDAVDRLVFCTGKIYYELIAEREKLGLKNVAIITLEMIAPFPFDKVAEQLNLYSKVDKGDGIKPGNVIWAQEEPKNMGAWAYVRPRFVTTLRESLHVDCVMRYVGRRAAAAPATGIASLHAAEQQAILTYTLLGHEGDTPRPSALLGHQT